jgi:23S rRNA (uracil1939-C5)-methyltransferase
MTQDWPDEIDLTITGIAQGGDGVGRFEDRPVFAAGALPGEPVRVRLRDRQTAFARGDVVEVMQASSDRIESACPKEAVCGAAGWRWIDYDAQLRFKAEILRDQLRHLGGIDIPVTTIHGAEEVTSAGLGLPSGRGWSYRTTAELHWENGKIGYYAPGSRRVMEIGQCCLHHPLINEAITALQLIKEDLPALRGVTLRCSPPLGEVLAVLEGEGRWEALAQRWMSEYPALVGVLQRTRNGVKRVRGQTYLEQIIDDVRWHVGAGSFFQINARQTARLIERVRTLMDVVPGQRILDLFCGVGTFAIPLRMAGAQVTGIESYAPAIEDARRSAVSNNVDDITWYAGPVEKMLERLDGPFDAAVLDPPRRGCESAALHRLASLGPRRLVYVSCHPGTLARDCKVLGRHGYEVKIAEVIDLFPHTQHVESIILLERS